jgi:excisionase family DNA binding protein
VTPTNAWERLGQPSRGVPRLALTPTEAAESLGVGLTTFKQKVQPDLRIVRRGRVRMIPLLELERWLKDNAERMLSGEP